MNMAREQKIQALIDHYMGDGAYDDLESAYDSLKFILQFGFKGYENYTDEELDVAIHDMDMFNENEREALL